MRAAGGGLVVPARAKPGMGAALYQVGEIHRVRGKLDEAERAFEVASDSMRCPGPGLAQLRLAQGRTEPRTRPSAGWSRTSASRAREPECWRAYVEILLATSDTGTARDAADELAAIAAAHEIPFLKALSSGTSGAVLLKDGRAREAMSELRRAWDLWRELQAPYEAGRVRCRSARLVGPWAARGGLLSN